jgi:hypothetical protein
MATQAQLEGFNELYLAITLGWRLILRSCAGMLRGFQMPKQKH